MTIACGPTPPSDGDRAAIAEFGAWLLAHPKPTPAARPVRRPQHCNCGAHQPAMTAHTHDCLSRRRSPR